MELESDSDTLIESLRNRPRIDAEANRPSPPIAPSRSVGAYEIIRAIGRGGMGAVYLARHRELGPEVALKILPPLPGDQDQHTARFLREIRTSGSLDHPAIARATDAGNVDGVQFLSKSLDDRPASAARVEEAVGPWCEGSDLAALVEQAAAAETAETDPADGIPVALSRPFVPSVAADREPLASRGGGGRRRWGWIAGALLPLSLIAAVVITLQTQRGTLVIESEVDDVRVELRRDGEKVKDVQIETGANTTRIWGGRYEVRLAEGSDRVAIDRQDFEILRRETVVARIRETRGSAEGIGTAEGVADSGTASSTEVIDEPTFQGKTIDDWLSVVKHERDTGLVEEAITAVKELVSPETEDRVRQAMLETIDRHGLSSAFDVLAMTDPEDDYVQFMLQQLQEGDAERRQVILEIGLFPASRAGWDLTGLFNWIDAQLLDRESDDSLRDAAALLYVDLINGGYYVESINDGSHRRSRRPTNRYRSVGTLDDELKQRLLITLRESRVLDPQFLAGEISAQRGRLAPELRQLLIDRSLEILKSTEVTEREFVESILVLRAYLGGSTDSRERAILHARLAEDEECMLAIQRGLQSLLGRPEGLYLITRIRDNSRVCVFAWPHSSAIPGWAGDRSSALGFGIKAEFDDPGNHASPVLEILNLLIALSEGTQFSNVTEFVDACEDLVERSEEGAGQLRSFKEEVLAPDRSRIVKFHWPSLQTSYEPFLHWPSLQTSYEPFLAPDQVSSPSPQQWLDTSSTFMPAICCQRSPRRMSKRQKVRPSTRRL